MDRVLAFGVGIHLSLLQFSYFFLLEAYHSSRATSYFIALFFWLIGFLVGLNLKSAHRFPIIMVGGVGAYYLALFLFKAFPFRDGMLLVVGACIALSGVGAGLFFPYARERFDRVKDLLFHENNGFILGIIISMMASVFAGKWLLQGAPLLVLVPLLVILIAESRRRSQRVLARKEAVPQLAARGLGFPPFSLGIAFGVLQVALFFCLQVYVTASFVAYFALIVAWFVGVLINLHFGVPRSIGKCMIVAAGAYYLLVILSSVLTPYRWLIPLYGILIVLTALPVGAFFRSYAGRLSGAGVFFHENNGFVLGYLASVVSFAVWGENFLHWGPIVALVFGYLAVMGHPGMSYLMLWVVAGVCLQKGTFGGFLILLAAAVVGGITLLLRPRAASISRKMEELGSQGSFPPILLRSILFLAGINVILLQFFITREFSSVLAASEVTILLVATAYFAGFSFGYGVSRFLSISFLKAAAVVMFFVHLVVLSTLKVSAGYFIHAGYGFEVLVGLILFSALLTSAFYSVFLPKFVTLLGSDSLKTVYGWELSGAVVGGILMTCLSSVAPQLLWPGYFGVFLLLVIFLLRRTGWAASFGFVGIFLVACLAGRQADLHAAGTEDYYQTRGYSNPGVVFSGNSPYHSVEIVDTHRDDARSEKKSRVSFINGVRYFDYEFGADGQLGSETGLSEFTYFLAELPAKMLSEKLGRKLRVLVLGCGSMVTLGRMMPYSEKTTLVEIDPLVVESAKTCWEGLNRFTELENCEIVIDDARHYLKTTDEKFDLIVNDISAPYYLGTALLHGREYYRLVRSRLKTHGLFSESTQGRPRASNPDGQAMKILRGVADAFSRYYMVETKGERRKQSGYVYAYKEKKFGSSDINAAMSEAGVSEGTEVHWLTCGHFPVWKSEPFSLSSMETVFSRNTFRMTDRLGLDDEERESRFSVSDSRFLGVVRAEFQRPRFLLGFGVVFLAAVLARVRAVRRRRMEGLAAPIAPALPSKPTPSKTMEESEPFSAQDEDSWKDPPQSHNPPPVAS